MENTLTEQELKEIQKIEHFRNNIMLFEKQLLDIEGSYGDPKNPGMSESANEINPLTHTFADGLYIREIFMPKGQIISTGIHKKKHPYFVLKGEISVLTQDGITKIKAPYHGITDPGTKRIIFIHEDSVWITVHATDKDNVEETLGDIVAKDFDDPEISIENMKKYLKLKNK
jgi:hypothetical protein